MQKPTSLTTYSNMFRATVIIDFVFNLKMRIHGSGSSSHPSPHVILPTCSPRVLLICHSLPQFASGGPRLVRSKDLHPPKMRPPRDL
jgi:hypothetical protein